MKLTWFAGVLMFLVAGGFAWKAQSQSQTSGAETLLKLEADFEKTTAERGFEGFISYFADDAADLPDGGLIVSGKENIRNTEGPWPSDISLTWTPVHADMAASGDLGYTFGNFVFKAKDKDGNPITRYGKYATVWKKQKDGSWKVAMDMGNSSPNPKP
jgi:ketosteroid isomerase-like protein